MIDSGVLALTNRALWLVLLLAAPAVFVAAFVGIFIAFLQAATQLQEQTLQFAAKFVAVVLTIFATASLVGGNLFNYADQIFTHFPMLVAN